MQFEELESIANGSERTTPIVFLMVCFFGRASLVKSTCKEDQHILQSFIEEMSGLGSIWVEGFPRNCLQYDAYARRILGSYFPSRRSESFSPLTATTEDGKVLLASLSTVEKWIPVGNFESPVKWPTSVPENVRILGSTVAVCAQGCPDERLFREADILFYSLAAFDRVHHILVRHRKRTIALLGSSDWQDWEVIVHAMEHIQSSVQRLCLDLVSDLTDLQRDLCVDPRCPSTALSCHWSEMAHFICLVSRESQTTSKLLENTIDQIGAFFQGLCSTLTSIQRKWAISVSAIHCMVNQVEISHEPRTKMAEVD